MATPPIYLKQSCIKTLTPVEAGTISNQHELNGVVQLKEIFGAERISKQAIFSIRGTDIICQDGITWYNARENTPGRREYRLYFQGNYVMEQAQTGDNIIVGIDQNNQTHIILIKQNTADYEGNIPEWR